MIGKARQASQISTIIVCLFLMILACRLPPLQKTDSASVSGSISTQEDQERSNRTTATTFQSPSSAEEQKPRQPETNDTESSTLKAEKKKSMPFTYGQILSKVKALLPSSHHLITVRGKVVLHFEDFNLDDVSEIICLGVKTFEPVNTDTLTNFSTLFSEDKKAYPFYLYIFSLTEESFALNTTVYLGKQFVYGGLSRIAINKNASYPFIISIVFQKQQGAEQEWLIFKGSLPDGEPGDLFKPVSQLNLKDTLLNTILIKDIDKDGTIDILLQEHGEVEGIGNETFLTWLKWNGTTFHEYASTNVVYNLRQFLQQVKKLVLERDWERLLGYAFQNGDIQRYKLNDYSESAIIFKAFDFTNIYRENTAPATVLTKVEDIIFPEILENPFFVQEEQGYPLNLSFRIENLDGTSHIGEISLYMSQNPFGKKQFFLALP